MDNKKKGLILSVLGIIGLIVITTGVTYSFFNYAKTGTTDNTITTGSITFLYTEVSEVGRGISISNAFPVSDEVGKAQTGEGNIFDFKVTSTTMNDSGIPYEITARKKTDSTLDESAIKLYLTKVSGDIEEEVLLENYSNLVQTTKVSIDKYTEKTLYTDKIPAGSTNYEQAYRLRMWIDDSINFSPTKDENGQDVYPYNQKTFTITVNVYANATVVTDEEVTLSNSTAIASITAGDTEATTVAEQDYDYKVTLPEGTTTTTITVETENENATVNIEKIDSLAYSNNSSIKRLSASKELELTPGNNYFKVTVISENKQVTNEYKINVNVKETVSIFGKKFEVIADSPTLTTTSNNASDASGLYKSTATNSGNATYYFRGNVENNYVDFAGQTWRIIRVNEDGTIRLIMQDGINDNKTYAFNSTSYTSVNYTHIYYTNSNIEASAMKTLEDWYNSNIANNSNYVSKIADKNNYFCEQAKVTSYSSYVSGDATMEVYQNYNPNFKCETDGNGKGIVNTDIGLITYDELTYAGGYYSKNNQDFYLYNGNYFWSMSPTGFTGSDMPVLWNLSSAGSVSSDRSYDARDTLRPVINLKADITVTGTGASDDHWVVQ